MALRQLFVVTALAAIVSSTPQNPQLSKLDNIDVEAILTNPERVEATFRCFLDDGDTSCNTQGKIIKSLISEMVKVNCKGCSEQQKEGVVNFMLYASKNRPAEWKQLVDKYDPTGEARAKYGDQWRAKGITV